MDADTYGEAVSVMVNILSPVIIFAAVQGWSYLQKRYQEHLFKYALALPANTSEQAVKDMVATKEPPPVEA